MKSFPGSFSLLTALALLTASCAAGIVKHAMMEVPPPGGCDKCHRAAISSTWSATLAPGRAPGPRPDPGEDQGPRPDPEVIKRYGEVIETIPVHAKAPAAKLKIYIEGMPPAEAAEPEAGVKCFVCHLGPNKEHETRKGTFAHPWGKKD